MIAVGTATYTRHDAHTRHILDGLRARLAKATDRELLAAAYRAESLSGHGLADEVRSIVEHEIEWRRVTQPAFTGWLLAAVAEVTR